MERMWMILLGSVLAVSCADVSNPVDPVGTAIPLPDEPGADRADVSASGHFFDVYGAADSKCDARTIIGAGDITNTTAGNAVVTEQIGAEGCVQERWVRDWDGELPLAEVYDVFVEWLPHNAYIDPYSYSHVWTYSADGSAIVQQRTRADEQDVFFEERQEFDTEGRLVEHTRDGDIFTNFEREFSEIWTFGPLSDEFETYTVRYNGEISSVERRVFDAAGSIIEEYYSNDGHSEHLIRRSGLDTNGALVVLETFDRTTGALETMTNIERRPDGTMSRKTEKNHRMGWFNVWEYDASERQTLYTQDETEDGSIEYEQISRYDNAGNLVFTSTEYGFDRPESSYAQTVSTFDAQDRLLESVSTPVWMHGESNRTRYQYDAVGSGYRVAYDVLNPAGQQVRAVSLERWLDAQRLAWRSSDIDRDEVLESLEVRRWDGSRQLERLTDHDGDGYVDSVEQWHYDAVGQLVEHVVDLDADHIADARTLHQY